MVFYICKTLILVAILHQAAAGRRKQEDFLEWRDYIDGKLPDTSIVVGRTSTFPGGIPIYVGLVHVEDGPNEGYLPTNIIGRVIPVNVSLDDETIISFDKNVKILCGKGHYTTRIFWVQTSQSTFPSVLESDQYRPVFAGWQFGEDNKVTFNSSIYVGKGTEGQFGANFVGKIYQNHPDPLKNNRLYSPGWYSTVTKFDTFDSLVWSLVI